MFLNVFNNFFDEAEKLLREGFDESMDKAFNESEEDDENKSYYHYVYDKFDNGEHVAHKEKEVKDGKVLKDVNDTKNIESKKKEDNKTEQKECHCNVGKDYKKLDEENNTLKVELLNDKAHISKIEGKLNELEKEIYRLHRECNELKDLNNKLSGENMNLKAKLDQIRKVF